ncbi:cytochrome C [Xanthomarina sp. F1114]|uniref:cytochrome C n=1 Tax=Xanthomarina sp. F1114 TaxID=2996019 RepID=UPI00225E2A41|nr:cytochrome C [Xanthomarina sp. F1114]MCX7547307.1 cytochrome C [Xanthomarina sp. F1114]
MEDHRIIKVFLDEDPKPFASFAPPVKVVLDTTKIPDGKHILKIVAKSSDGIEGIREIPFVVRNGPSISVVGLKENETVDTNVPLIINAYGSENKDFFVIKGSETPKAIPAWVWALVILFIAFGVFYLIMYWNQELYGSFV